MNVDDYTISRFESIKDEPYAVLLDSCGLGSKTLIAHRPLSVVHGSPFQAMREKKEKGVWVGIVAYDIEDSVFGFYEEVEVLRDSPPLRLRGGAGGGGDTRLSSNFTKSQYLQAIKKVKDYIAAGDCYQVNLSQRFEASCEIGSWEIYKRLRQTSPAPYAAYLNFGKTQILSSSPESFLKFERRQVTTRPIKGTRPRGASEKEDERLKKELLGSEKDRAELLMITDLERNDLGRVCRPGTIHVPKLARLESYAQVHHLVSTIRGELAPGKTAIDCLEAAFPGGSITGTPKIRAMQIIRELENVPRRFYTGAIGYLDTDGQGEFNVAIRTATIQAGRVQFHTGGGIVADSDPETEYGETLTKAKGIMEALAIL